MFILTPYEINKCDCVGCFRVQAVIFGDINFGDKALDGLGAVWTSTITEVSVEDFTMAHANVFVGFEGVTDVNFGVGGGEGR